MYAANLSMNIAPETGLEEEVSILQEKWIVKLKVRYKVSRHKISYRTCCTEDTALSVVALSLSPLLPSPYSEVMQNKLELAALVLLLCNVSISKSLRMNKTPRHLCKRLDGPFIPFSWSCLV